MYEPAPHNQPSRPRRQRRRRHHRSRKLLLLLPVLAAALIAHVLLSNPPLTPAPEAELLPQLEALQADYPDVSAILDAPSNYPVQLLELLIRNPETLPFVLDYPAHKDDPPANTVGDIAQGEFPLLMQWDQRWGYTQYGDGPIALTGCGPTVLSMAVCGLTGENTVTPATVAAYAQEAGFYVNSVGTSWDLMSAGCRQFGLEAQELPLMRSSLVKALEGGQPIVCSVRAGDFTTSGHFILITGMEDGKFRINDPNRYSTSKKLWDYDRLPPQISNLWAYSLKS